MLFGVKEEVGCVLVLTPSLHNVLLFQADLRKKPCGLVAAAGRKVW